MRVTYRLGEFGHSGGYVRPRGARLRLGGGASSGPQLLAQLRLHGSVDGDGEAARRFDLSPGGTALSYAPGVQLELTPDWSVEMSYQAAPIDLGGSELREPGKWVVGVAWRF